MITPFWTWTKTWKVALSPTELRKVQEDILCELEQRDYASRDIFAFRLAFEEVFGELIRTKTSVDELETIEISCHGTADRLQLHVDGHLRYEK